MAGTHANEKAAERAWQDKEAAERLGEAGVLGVKGVKALKAAKSGEKAGEETRDLYRVAQRGNGVAEREHGLNPVIIRSTKRLGMTAVLGSVGIFKQ